MSRRKLIVAGCSYSDYTKVDNVYGELLAQKLDFDYIHEAAGCGSNWRIWRKITKHVLNGNLTSNDLLIVQYTEILRNEFWTRLEEPNNFYKTKDGLLLSPSHDTEYDGIINRWKMNSHNWQVNDKLSKFHKDYEDYFVSDEFAYEQWKTHNYMFQCMLSMNNIPTIFVNSVRINNELWSRSLSDSTNILPTYKKHMYVQSDRHSPKHDLEQGDIWHMNSVGHEYEAENLYNHIQTTRILHEPLFATI